MPPRHRLQLILTLLAAAASLPAQQTQTQTQTHTVTPSDIANLRHIEAPHLSPDGRLVVYSVETPVPSGKPQNQHLFLAATDKPGSARPLAYTTSVDTAPAFAPDSLHVAFLSDRPNPLAAEPGASPFRFTLAPGTDRPDLPTPETAPKGPQPPNSPTDTEPQPKGLQLWLVTLDTGEVEPLTNLPGGLRSFKFSHDGKHIAFIRTDADSKADRDRKLAKTDQNVLDHDFHFDRLWIYDLDTHQARLLTHQDVNIDTADWSPNDASIVARVSPTPRLDDYWRVSKVQLFDTTSGALTQTVEEHSGYQQPLFSDDGKLLAYSRFTPLGITDVHFVRNLATGKDLRLEDKLKGTIASMQFTAGNRLLVMAYVGAHTEALLVSPGFDITPLAGLPLTALDLDISRDGNTISFLGETPSQPAEIAILRSGAATTLTSTNPQVASWSLGTEREITWQNPKDHHTVFGVLSLPPGYQPGQKYKTAIHLHGGPEEAFTVGFNGNWYNYAALLASQGYVVLQPNYRGSAGQEIAFTEGNYQDWGGHDFDDMMSGVDTIIKQGIADPNRLVLSGWSFGGFMTAWAVTHTDRFKAGMAGAPVTDAFSMSLTTDIAPRYASSYLGDFATASATYDRHSSVRFAAACHTPVLFLHGESDPRVPLSQSQELYHALHFLGRETMMVTYPREPHIFTEREHQVDSLTRILDWFNTHLPQ